MCNWFEVESNCDIITGSKLGIDLTSRHVTIFLTEIVFVKRQKWITTYDKFIFLILQRKTGMSYLHKCSWYIPEDSRRIFLSVQVEQGDKFHRSDILQSPCMSGFVLEGNVLKFDMHNKKKFMYYFCYENKTLSEWS